MSQCQGMLQADHVTRPLVVTLPPLASNSQMPQHGKEPETHRNDKTVLQELATAHEANLVTTFISKLDDIYSFSLEDVQNCLSTFNKDVLGKLHKTLTRKVSDSFPEFGERKAINRQVKHTMLSDIAVLGYTLVNGIPHKEVEKIFHPPTTSTCSPRDEDTNSALNQEEVAHLIKVVASLNSRVSELEREIAELRGRPAQLAPPEQESAQTEQFTSCSSDNEEDGSDSERSVDLPVMQDVVGFTLTKKQRRKAKRHQRRMAARQAAITPQQPVDKTDQTTNPSASSQVADSYAQAVRRGGTDLSERVTNSTQCTQPKAARPVEVANNVAINPSSSKKSSQGVEAARPPSSHSALYIGGVKPSNSADDIRCHILQQGASRCGNVEILSDKENWRSFKAEVPTADMDRLCNPKVWPSGIQIRPFRDRKFNRPFDQQQRTARSYHERRRNSRYSWERKKGQFTYSRHTPRSHNRQSTYQSWDYDNSQSQYGRTTQQWESW